MLRSIPTSTLMIAMLLAACGCGGGGSSTGDVTNTQKSLTLSSVSPSSATAGDPDLKLSVIGSNFDSGAHRVNQIVWTGERSLYPDCRNFPEHHSAHSCFASKVVGLARNREFDCRGMGRHG